MAEQNEILTETAVSEEASSIERCLTFESGGAHPLFKHQLCD